MRPATAPAVAVPGSAECGVKGKKPKTAAGGGRDPGAESRGTRELPKRQTAADGRARERPGVREPGVWRFFVAGATDASAWT